MYFILQIRAKNFYREGETNIMNAPMEKSIQLCWDELNEMANIKEKRAEVTEFNRLVTVKYFRLLKT